MAWTKQYAVHSFNRYAYANNNPYKYVDPDGRYVEAPLEAVSLGVGIASLGSNLYDGNYGSAALDTLGIAADVVLAMVPFAPGAVSIGIQTSRHADELVDVAKGADDLVSVRHHTSPGNLPGIKADNAINPGRGNPAGVHVEVAPFGSAKTASAETGAFGKGAFVEFQVPKSTINPTNVGPRNTGVIPSNSPLPLQGTGATFNKVPWWQF